MTFLPQGPHHEDTITLILGGAGFIGCNLAHRLATQGRKVRVFDNLSRHGVERNLQDLVDLYGDQIEVFENDLANTRALKMALQGTGSIFHCAGQVAVTASLDDPGRDLNANIQGTLNVLEQARGEANPPFLLFTSTNKVYGELTYLSVIQRESHYEPVDVQIRNHGLSENTQLDFRTPYGCSKGAAESYVLDYARSYGMPNVVFRMSCVYGPHQFGTEDQGWVAHFLLQALRNQPITVFGDGRQVRDLLMVSDLIDAFLAAEAHPDRVSGHAFNIGGGVHNAASVSQILGEITTLVGRQPVLRMAPWRIADQKYYVSDTRRFVNATNWKAGTSIRDGLVALHSWLVEKHEQHAAIGSLSNPDRPDSLPTADGQ